MRLLTSSPTSLEWGSVLSRLPFPASSLLPLISARPILTQRRKDAETQRSLQTATDSLRLGVFAPLRLIPSPDRSSVQTPFVQSNPPTPTPPVTAAEAAAAAASSKLLVLRSLRYFPAGIVIIPAGIVIFPGGTGAIPAGKMTIPAGKAAIPTGIMAIPVGREAIPAGKTAIPAGNTTIPSGIVAIPGGREAIPAGKNDGSPFIYFGSLRQMGCSISIFRYKPARC